MIRKPPVRTYQKKKAAQSAICYSQPKFVEPRTFSKRLSRSGKKNKTQDDNMTIEDDSSFNLETTFDRIAKTAKLPPPPLQESHCSLNISSDVPVDEPSPVKTDVYEYPWSKEAGKSKATKRAKRKPAHSRTIYIEDELFVNKRFKHDSMNTSTKKVKAVRSSRRKVPAKTGKNVTDIKGKQEIHFSCFALGDSKELFATQPVKKTGKAENRKEQNGYRLRRRANVNRIPSESSSDSDSKNYETNLMKVKTKPKKKNIVSKRNAGRGKLKISDFVNKSSRKVQVGDKDGEEKDCAIERLPETENEKGSSSDFRYSINTSRINTISNRTRSKVAIKNSPALEYVENFRRYTDSKSINNDLDPADSHKYNRILTNKQYRNKTQPKFGRKSNAQKPTDPLDDLNNSNESQNDIELEKNSNNVTTCSVVLPKCNENKNTTSNGEVVTRNCNNHSSKDIFQSSISNTSDIERETNDAVKMRLLEPAVTQQVQSIENQSDVASNLDLDIKPDEVKIARESTDRKLRCDPNRSLYHLMCSTPINAHMKLDKTINFLSPITATEQRSQNDTKFADKKEAGRLSAVNCIANSTSHSKEHSDLPRTNMRRKSTRKRLSISYKEDKSLGMSDEHCREKNIIEKIPVENIANREYSSRHDNSVQMRSPTSQIQESLEILKLNLDNSIYKRDTDNRGTGRLSQERIVPTDNNGSNRISESTNKYDDTNEFTGGTKDSCSQLTPVGIITTRSGRQLKLSMTMQKNFLNESNGSKSHPDIDTEIIDDSEIVRNRSWKNRITKRRGSRFAALKSHSTRNTSERMKSLDSTDTSTAHENDSSKVSSMMDTSEEQISKDSTSCGSRNRNTSRKSETIPLHRRSDCSTSKSGKESNINYSTSSLDERNNTSSSVVPDPETKYSRSSNLEILQSIVDSTKNLDSLSIRSHSEEKCEDDNSKDSEWSTLSSNDNVDSIKSNLEDEIKEESCKQNRSENLSASPSRNLLISDQDELDSDRSNNASKNSIESPLNLSPEHTETALLERMELLSSRINTRKRRKTVLKPLPENILQVFIKEEAAVQTFKHSELPNSLVVCSRNELDLNGHEDIENIELSAAKPEGLNLYNVNVKENFQPVVLLEKLEDPLRITANERRNRGLGLTAIHETSNETSRTIGKDSNCSFTPDDSEINENDEDFEKSDPLYCPPEKSDADNSFKVKMISQSHADAGFSKLDLSAPEITARQSVLESLLQCLLMRSRNDDSPRKSKRSSRRKSNKRNSSSKFDYSISKLNKSETEVTGRQSLFLKPGKEYARSLSILNNIQNGSVLEQFSVEKGKNWHKSVQTILAMQEEGLVQSCLGKNEDDADTRPRFRALSCITIPDTQPCSEEQSVGSASPSRFIKRMSIRVVPDNKRLTHIEDTSFLEAYGITASKSRKTLCKNSEIQSSEKTLTKNVQCTDAAIETVETERVITPRDVVLQRCNQDDYLSFSKCFPSSYLENCRKIGEGVYGEVFLYETRKQKSVIKIIPIEGEALVNGERQKRFDEILSEIVIAKELHNLRYGDEYQTYGFVEVKNIRCVKGKYPEKLIELWKAYDNEKGSDNDCPSMFNRHQLFIVLELGHGGEDLEAFVFHSADEAHALFVQTAAALAVAEQSLEFEHRDLHWGNVLISETKDTEITYRLNNKDYKYPTKGLQVAIIDFTLSRMSYDGCCIFNDLALDPALFTAQGEYQFEIYRLMRDKVANNWQEFEPYTNILWLHYTLDKMMTSLRYKRKYARVHREGLFRLHALKEVVLNYASAFDFVTNCEEITNLRCNSETETTEEPIQIE